MAPQCVDGLEQALTKASLSHHASAAAEWCERMGPRDLAEIAEEDVFETLTGDLKLKPLEIRRLQKVLGCDVAPLRPSSSSGSGHEATSSAAKAISSAVWQADGAASGSARAPGIPDGQVVVVRNTFLNLDEGSSPSVALRKLVTEPPQRWDEATRACAEVEELLNGGGDMEAESDEPDDSPEVSSPSAGIYKTVTYDGYDSVDQWVWPMGDPNRHPTVPEETGPGEEEPTYVGGQQQQHAPQMMPEQQPMVGMVMVPAEAMQGYPMPMASAGGGWSFPGCIAVPMNRFEGWPVDAAAMAQQQVPVPVDGALGAGPAHDTSVGASAPSGTANQSSSSSGQRPSGAQVGDAAAEDGPRRAIALQRAFSVASSIYRIRWTVDARKLVSTDREHASPTFDLSFGENLQFRMIMRPKVINNEKGGCCFKKARGRGRILLRCLSDVDTVVKPVVTFRIAVGSGNPAKQAVPRGPVRHDFSESPIVGLPEAQQQWDFTKAIDKTKHTFVVCLEVMPA